jgi:predicted ATP-dependent endonuclease of OLD family
MHLQRVQVPNFRALKNIDITFEKERIPRIFPLASLNGGGKSTLLQLIFTLLTCSADPDKHEFLVNLLKDFEIDYKLGSKLAKIDIFDGETSISLDFTCQSTCLLIDQFLPNSEEAINLKDFGFVEISKKILLLEKEIELLKSEKKVIANKIEYLHNQTKSIDEKQNSPLRVNPSTPGYLNIPGLSLNLPEREEVTETRNYNRKLNKIELELNSKIDEYICIDVLQRCKDNIRESLLSNNVQYICSCRSNDNCDEISVLCHVSSNANTDILQEISKKVFLAAPASQVFLFFNRQEIDCLFGNRTNGESYESIAQKNQDKLSGFFLHDFSTIKILAKAFEKAKENDWQQAIQTRGEYGTEYAKISKDLEYVFSGKIIEPLKDLSGIIVKTIENGQERILHPEDLSHGELRRLSFYAWLRTKEIKDSIVLVDEIEIGLHPDWQYQIVKDLEEWAPSNQYILATHSYEICSALTPAHVKEIEPKLVKPETASAH